MFPLLTQGQVLFGAAGGTISTGQHQFDFSMGEPIVAEVSGTDFTAQIGFQQPYIDFFTSIVNTETNGFQLFPNPFSNGFRFEASEEIEYYMLVDASGKIVSQCKAAGTAFEWNQAGLPKGLYLLRVFLTNGKTINSPIVHQ